MENEYVLCAFRYLKSPFCADLRAAFAAQAEADDDISFEWPEGLNFDILIITLRFP